MQTKREEKEEDELVNEAKLPDLRWSEPNESRMH